LLHQQCATQSTDESIQFTGSGKEVEMVELVELVECKNQLDCRHNSAKLVLVIDWFFKCASQ
jgi:hypothetical protein